MFALRRTPRALSTRLGSASFASTSPQLYSIAPESSNVASNPGPDAQRPPTPRRFFNPPKPWSRPLEEGVIPAYDLSLEVLKRDSERVKQEADALREQVQAKQQEYSTLRSESKRESQDAAAVTTATEKLAALEKDLERMLTKLHILDVQSEINLPWVRWKVKTGTVDMRNPAQRHLVEQKWTEDGPLDLLMERVYQMKAIPDILPEIKPELDLHIVTQTRVEDEATKKVLTPVEPGVFLTPEQTLLPPDLYATVFHTDVRLYTMLLVDLDVPNPESQSYTTFLHWMKPNIPLSATSPRLLSDLNSHTQYIPPHPQRGSRYHRYVCLLLPQPSVGASPYSRAKEARANGGLTSKRLDIPVVPSSERLGFNVREFVSRWGLNGNSGGLHMWREQWDETVSAIYKDILKIDEPHYGRPPKVDVYSQLKERRYIA